MKKRQKAAMTRKEALAALWKLYDVVGGHLYHEHASEEAKSLRGRTAEALLVLQDAIHGKPPQGATLSLCNACYLRYASLDHLWVYLEDEIGGPKDVCPKCMARLKAEGKIDHFKNWETGEVTPC